MAPENQQEAPYRPLVLIAVVLGSLALFAVFFLGFLVAPLAVLAVFYLIFSAADRSKRSSPPPAPGTR